MRALVIGHRGASGYRPEHTLAAYELAIRQGADFIEPDLVSTRDGVLVARHENALAVVDASTGALIEATTNVHEMARFAGRKSKKTIDGRSVTGWFTEDFSLAELKTLKARERVPRLRPRNATYDDLFDIPTLQEVIDLAKARSAALGRTIGICPETKHPGYFLSIGLPIEETLVAALHSAYGNARDVPAFIQSFEVANLQGLHGLTNIRLIQLMDAAGQPCDFARTGDSRTFADLATPAGLDFIKAYADGIGVHKDLIIPRNPDGSLAAHTPLVGDAHARGLTVYGWTFRAENEFLPAGFRDGTVGTALGDGEREIAVFLDAGMDGFFTDQPDVGFAARERRRAR